MSRNHLNLKSAFGRKFALTQLGRGAIKCAWELGPIRRDLHYVSAHS